MSDIFYLSLALLLGAALRLPFHVLMPMRFEAGLPAGDFSGVRAKIAHMQRNRWVVYEVDDSVIPGTFGYPVLFHWLVSRFPQRWWRRTSVVLNVLPDLIAAAAVYAVVRYRLPPSTQEPAAIAFLAALLLLTAPILLPVTSRQKATNGRAFGLLLVIFALVATVLGMQPHGWGWYSAAVIATCLAALTSMFALQVLVFFAPMFAVLYLHLAPLLTVGAALAIGMAFPALGIREVVLFKLSHFFWYRRIKTTMTTTASNRSFLRSLVDFFSALRRNRRRARSLALYDAPLVILGYSLPTLGLLAWGVAIDGTALLGDPVLRFCLVTIAAATLVFLITSTATFAEWGQSERYFEYAAPMVVIAAVLLGSNVGVSWSVLLMLLVIQLLLLAWMHLYNELPLARLLSDFPDEADEIQVVEFLASRREQVHMTAVPQQMQRYWPRHFRAYPGNRVRHLYGLIRQPGLAPTRGFPYMEELFSEHYQVPSVGIEELHRRYGIAYVVALRRFLESVASTPFAQGLQSLCEVAFENGKYIVYHYRKQTQVVAPHTIAMPPEEDNR